MALKVKGFDVNCFIEFLYFRTSFHLSAHEKGNRAYNLCMKLSMWIYYNK